MSVFLTCSSIFFIAQFTFFFRTFCANTRTQTHVYLVFPLPSKIRGLTVQFLSCSGKGRPNSTSSYSDTIQEGSWNKGLCKEGTVWLKDAWRDNKIQRNECSSDSNTLCSVKYSICKFIYIGMVHLEMNRRVSTFNFSIFSCTLILIVTVLKFLVMHYQCDNPFSTRLAMLWSVIVCLVIVSWFPPSLFRNGCSWPHSKQTIEKKHDSIVDFILA